MEGWSEFTARPGNFHRGVTTLKKSLQRDDVVRPKRCHMLVLLCRKIHCLDSEGIHFCKKNTDFRPRICNIWLIGMRIYIQIIRIRRMMITSMPKTKRRLTTAYKNKFIFTILVTWVAAVLWCKDWAESTFITSPTTVRFLSFHYSCIECTLVVECI